MKHFFLLPFTVLLTTTFSSRAQVTEKVPPRPNLKEDTTIVGYFNQDNLLDALVIYSDTEELRLGSFLDTCIFHPAVIYIGQTDGTFQSFNETPLLFPCPAFHGRSDNTYDTLLLRKQEIVWRTCIAPRFEDGFALVTFTFQYSEPLHAFTLVDYLEHFFPAPSLDESFIYHPSELELVEISRIPFSFEHWQGLIGKSSEE